MENIILMMNIKIIKVNFLTYLFVFLIIYSGYINYLIYFSIVFIFHELGHIFFAKLFNIKILKIEIFPYGGMIKLNKKLNIEIYKDFLIAAGGFIFQFILLAINLLFIKNNLLNYINKLIFVMNIIPVIPLDGSQLFFIFFSKYLSYFQSLKLFYLFDILFLLLTISYGFFMGDLNVSYIIFCFCSFIIQVKAKDYRLNSFYLERYLYCFPFKKIKYQIKNDIHFLKREEKSFFYDNNWKSEKEILTKKFDNCSEFW